MTFEEAKAIVLENAITSACASRYKNLTTWEELSDAAEREANFAKEKIANLNDVMSHAHTHEKSNETPGEVVFVLDMGYADKSVIDFLNVPERMDDQP